MPDTRGMHHRRLRVRLETRSPRHRGHAAAPQRGLPLAHDRLPQRARLRLPSRSRTPKLTWIDGDRAAGAARVRGGLRAPDRARASSSSRSGRSTRRASRPPEPLVVDRLRPAARHGRRRAPPRRAAVSRRCWIVRTLSQSMIAPVTATTRKPGQMSAHSEVEEDQRAHRLHHVGDGVERRGDLHRPREHVARDEVRREEQQREEDQPAGVRRRRAARLERDQLHVARRTRPPTAPAMRDQQHEAEHAAGDLDPEDQAEQHDRRRRSARP